MTTDTRQLLELAAKACGLKYSDDYEQQAGLWITSGGRFWNPITSDADCAWMETALELDIQWFGNLSDPVEADKFVNVAAWRNMSKVAEVDEEFANHPSPGHARRMASTRVAAEIQRQKEAS